MKGAAFAALLVLMVLTVASTLVAILLKDDPQENLLKLSQLLFSWQVVAGGLAVGGGSTFKEEIKGVLKKFAR